MKRGSTNLGYACINMTLAEKENITVGRTCRKSTFLKKGTKHAGELFAINLKAVKRILEWNVDNKIFLYRMSSSMAPWCSEYNLEDLPNWQECKELLSKCGKFALNNNIRLSFHPGAFTVLAGHNQETVEKSINELETHGKIMDYMHQPRSHMAKINIHVGGSYGDKSAAALRWINNSKRLSNSVLSRLTLENDDRPNLYSTRDLYELFYSRTGIPIVFDYHHHLCHPGQDDEQTALHLAASTWSDSKQCTHYSETAQVDNPKAMFRAHSKYVTGFINPHGLDIDVVIEAKGKELAVKNYRKIHGEQK